MNKVEDAIYKPQVAIIGAGLAGLTMALRLYQKGYHVDVFEARTRVGGRVLSVIMENVTGQDPIVEVGGHNINDGAAAENFLKLANELDLNIITEIMPLEKTEVYFEGKYFNFYELIALSFPNLEAMNAEVDTLAKDCDSMRMLIEKLCGNNPPLKMALISRLTAYEGVEIDQQSIFHNIETLKHALKGGMTIQEGSSAKEAFRIKKIEGGNAQLPLKIASLLGQHIKLQHKLTQLSKEGNKVKLRFNNGLELRYEKVVLAFPASVYKNIEFDNFLLCPSKLKIINGIHYGKNYKIIFPIDHEMKSKDNAILITEDQVTFTTNNTTMGVIYCNKFINQPLSTLQIVKNSYPSWHVPVSIPQLIKDEHYLKYSHAITYRWDNDPLAQGSYSGYSRDHFSALNEKVLFNNVMVRKIFEPIDEQLYFVGEHTTILDPIGTMEAAVESAERISTLF